MASKIEAILIVGFAIWVVIIFLPAILVAAGIVDFSVVVPIYYIVVPVLFFTLFGLAVAASVSEYAKHKPVVDRKRVEQFKQYARIVFGRITLPEETLVELGDVVLKGYLAVEGSGRSRRYVYKSTVNVANSEIVKLGFVDLDKLCDRPFFVFANGTKTVVVDAPGFRVLSGEFKDMTLVCLEPSSIPEREVEAQAGDPSEHGKAKVKVGPRGFDVELTWVYRTPVEKKVVYDKEKGVYRVVEEYTAKPRARGARVELCVQTPSGKHCTVLAKTGEPNKPVKATYPFEVREKVLHLGGVDYDLIKGSVKTNLGYTVAGYKPGYMTVKVVLDIPRGRDIETETPL